MNGKIEYINPSGLMQNSAFTQVVTTQGIGKTIYISGQNAVNQNREIVGKGDIQAQTEQAMQNIQIALETCGADFENLVKLSIYIVQGQNLLNGFQASQKYLEHLIHPPAIAVLIVARLANPEYLVEIEGIAYLPSSNTN